MGAIISFFTGPLGKIALYAIGALFAAGLIFAGWHHYDTLVTDVAILKQQNAQMQRAVADAEKSVKDTENLMKIQSDSLTSLQEAVDTTNANYDNLNNFLNSPEVQKGDRPSSDLLKQTVRKLKELRK